MFFRFVYNKDYSLEIGNNYIGMFKNELNDFCILFFLTVVLISLYKTFAFLQKKSKQLRPKYYFFIPTTLF